MKTHFPACRFFAAFLSWLALGFATANAQDPLVITNVNVVPMDEERIIENQTVIIQSGQIVHIGAGNGIDLPEEAVEIDAIGKFLMPGLAEMHAHVPRADADQHYREDTLFLYLANGITLARGMLGDSIHLELRHKLASGEIPGPRLVTSGPGFGGNVTSPVEGIRLVREQAEAGYDFLKIFGGFSVEAFDAICHAASEAGIPFAGHVPATCRATPASSVPSKMATPPSTTSTPTCPPSSTPTKPKTSTAASSATASLPMPNRNTSPQWFNVPGFSTHREMHIMADAGLSPYEVLKTGTINPAIFLGEENVFGRVAEGLRADLVLVEDNPLEDLANAANIVGVIRHGHWYSRADIDEKLAEIAARYED